jgi:hypothetical protein
VNEAERAELFKQITDDQDRTAKFIDGNTTSVIAIRGWAITIWLAVLGVAFSSKLWELAALDVVVIFVFAVIDGYHSSLYTEVLLHAKKLEWITYLHYVVLTTGSMDPDAQSDLDKALAVLKIGVYSNLRRFKPRDIWYAEPTVFIRYMYPFLAAAALASAILIAASSAAPTATTGN